MSNKKVRPASGRLKRLNEENSKPCSPNLRRSPRCSGLGKNDVSPTVAVKRSITVRKIAPRKTQRSSEGNKENVTSAGKADKQKRSSLVTGSAPASTSPHPAEISHVLAPASSPTPAEPEPQEWVQKVRRSYSRLSSESSSPEVVQCSPASGRRGTLFGFEQLQTPPVMRQGSERRRVAGEASLSISFLEGSSYMPGSPQPDPNIPGVAVLKEKRRRRVRVPQINMSELDLLAAKMNAEFEEAEAFDLVVE